jgi:hypothetical protein
MTAPRVILRALYDAGALPVDVALRFNLECRERPSILSREALREEGESEERKIGHAEKS